MALTKVTDELLATSYLKADGSRELTDDMTVTALKTIDGRDLSVDGTKLDAIEASATADQTDAEIETAYNNQVAIVSQVDAEAGTSTTRQGWTAQRVSQAIAALALIDIGCKVNNSANITLTTGVFTDLTFNTEDKDTDTMHSTSTNSERITIKTAGTYLITGNTTQASNSTGRRILSINNSAGLQISTVQENPSSVSSHKHQVSVIIDAAVDDWFVLNAFQNSGGDLDVSAVTGSSPVFSAQLLAIP